MVKLSQVKSNPNNPRFIKDEKFEQLVHSIVLFPQMMPLRPIVYDENNHALGGNMRGKAIKEIKERGVEFAEKLLKSNNHPKPEETLKLLEPIFKGYFPEGWVKQELGLSEQQKDEFIIKDNVAFGAWDFDALANNWDVELLEDWGLDIPGFKNPDDEEEQGEKTYIPTFKFEVVCKTESERNSLMAELLGRGYTCSDDY